MSDIDDKPEHYIEVEGSHEALFTNPGVVAGGLLQALTA